MAAGKDVEILIVEDNPDHADLILRVLKKRNLANRILVARDGREALDFIFGNGVHAGRQVDERPKLILLDLKLPKVDGMEVLKKVKSDERTKVIPIVILTSSQEEWDVSESYKLGVNSYIVKPVTFENFSDAVSELGLYWMLLNKPAR